VSAEGDRASYNGGAPHQLFAGLRTQVAALIWFSAMP
jgi:hypothetical protein